MPWHGPILDVGGSVADQPCSVSTRGCRFDGSAGGGSPGRCAGNRRGLSATRRGPARTTTCRSSRATPASPDHRGKSPSASPRSAAVTTAPRARSRPAAAAAGCSRASPASDGMLRAPPPCPPLLPGSGAGRRDRSPPATPSTSVERGRERSTRASTAPRSRARTPPARPATTATSSAAPADADESHPTPSTTCVLQLETPQRHHPPATAEHHPPEHARTDPAPHTTSDAGPQRPPLTTGR
jgi:hypothetical protein